MRTKQLIFGCPALLQHQPPFPTHATDLPDQYRQGNRLPGCKCKQTILSITFIKLALRHECFLSILLHTDQHVGKQW